MRIQVISLLLLLCFTRQLVAKDIAIEKGESVYKVVIPDTYEYHPTFFGLENVVMSRREQERGTSSLSITITGVEAFQLNSQELAGSQKEYQSGRIKYLEDRGLNLLEFIPYELKKNSQNFQIHNVGMVYTNGKMVTVERSYMIECPGSFVHGKIVGDIGPLKDQKSFKKISFRTTELSELEKVILGLTCQIKK